MKFIISFASDYSLNNEKRIEKDITTLQQLVSILQEYKHSLILERYDSNKNEMYSTICDTHID